MPTPSLLLVPFRIKAGKIYSELPETGAGDFTVTRTTSPTAGQSTRINSLGYIELVADNVPRLSYPLGGAVNGCPSLLIEQGAQNIFLQSQTIGASPWFVDNLTITSNVTATLDPSGGNTAEKIVATVAGPNHYVTRSSATQTGQHTYSIFAKAAEYNFVRLSDIQAGYFNASFDLVNGTVASSGGLAPGGVVASIENYGNGWYRCIVNYDGTGAPSGGPANAVVGIPTAGTQISYTGDGTSGIYVWGAQLETGLVATSYIPTAASAITRVNEGVEKTGISGLIGQSEGTIYAEIVYSNINQLKTIVDTNNGTANNRIGIRVYSTTVLSVAVVVGGNNFFLSPTIPALPSSGVLKIALAYKANDYALSWNGSIFTDTSTRPVPPLSSVYLGNNGFGSEFLNDRIRSLAFYPNRLTNAELQSLTQ